MQQSAACKSHKEAESRRRKRINAHLATLRTLLPNLIKTDKASVLGEVVRQVRELKKAAAATNSSNNDNNNNIPGEWDEVGVHRSENDKNTLIARLCCEDRPELMVDLTRALRSVKAKVLRAEIATVGGRTITVLSVSGVASGAPQALLTRAFKVVADKPPSPSPSPSPSSSFSSSLHSHSHPHPHPHPLNIIMTPPSYY